MTTGVSVIIPVYNGEEYLKECLDSVLRQSVADMQIICVNDGSTDGSAAILAEYEAKDPRIEIIAQPNQGLSSARNRGIKNARGKYIQFLDCDDRLADGALAKLYELAEANKLDILYYDGIAFCDETKTDESELARYSQLYLCKVPIIGVVSGLEMFEKLYYGKSYRASACLQMIRRDFLIEKQISFYEGILYEDNLFTLTSMTQALRTGYCHQAFYERRVHVGSIVTSRKNFQHVRSYVLAYIELCHYAFRNSFSARVMEGIVAQVRSLRNHAIEGFEQLTEEEKAEAKQRDVTYELVQLFCTANNPKNTRFIPQHVPEQPFLRFWVLFPMRIHNAFELLVNEGWRAVFDKLCNKLKIKQVKYHPSNRIKEIVKTPVKQITHVEDQKGANIHGGKGK